MNYYDFDTPVDRRGTGSLKWDVAEGELPMWVADMDFQTAPEIRDALAERLKHGVFGYSIIPDAWYESYIRWWKERHAFEMDPEWLIFATGVVPILSSVVRKLTTPAEKVLIQTPVYNIFYNSILNNGRQVIENPLVYDGDAYMMNFADLEDKLDDPQTTLMILCNPHNPVGKIWDADTLRTVADLCDKYHVTVISDEIHCDVTDPGFGYVPFASVSETAKRISVTAIAPTKAFNIAGLQTACACVPDPFLRNKVSRGLNTDEVAEPNAFAVDAAVAAFSKGGPWLDELRAYLFENKQYVRHYVMEQQLPLHVVPQHATYLLWVDIHETGLTSKEFCSRIRRETGLYLSNGEQFGGDGEHFFRLNTACPRITLYDGMKRMKKGLERLVSAS